VREERKRKVQRETEAERGKHSVFFRYLSIKREKRKKNNIHTNNQRRCLRYRLHLLVLDKFNGLCIEIQEDIRGVLRKVPCCGFTLKHRVRTDLENGGRAAESLDSGTGEAALRDSGQCLRLQVQGGRLSLC